MGSGDDPLLFAVDGVTHRADPERLPVGPDPRVLMAFAGHAPPESDVEVRGPSRRHQLHRGTAADRWDQSRSCTRSLVQVRPVEPLSAVCLKPDRVLSATVPPKTGWRRARPALLTHHHCNDPRPRFVTEPRPRLDRERTGHLQPVVLDEPPDRLEDRAFGLVSGRSPRASETTQDTSASCFVATARSSSTDPHSAHRYARTVPSRLEVRMR